MIVDKRNLFFLLYIAAMIFCVFSMNWKNVETDVTLYLNEESETRQGLATMNEHFAMFSSARVMVSNVTYEEAVSLYEQISEVEGVTMVTFSNTELVDGIMLTDSLNAREFSEALGIDYDMVATLFSVYAMDQGEIGKLVSMDTYRLPVFDLVCYLKEMIESSGLALEGEMGEMLSMLSMLDMAKEQLQTESYSRMVVYLELPDEGEETYAFLEQIHTIADKYYDQPVYAIGNSTSCRDLGSTFATDNMMITVLSIVFVIAVLLFTFKSAGLPILLVIVIQGSVWMNFSFPTLLQEPLYFLGYLIVQSIQMGANIDYAIVISSHFNEEKQHMPVKEAICVAINKAFPTILTSGSIMAVMGFLLGAISTSPVNAIMGQCIGRGTVISMLLVLFVLPCILVIGNRIIDATSFEMKGSDIVEREDMGTMRVKGRLHGYVDGYIDGEVDAIVHGRVHAAVVAGNLSVDMQEADSNAVEKARRTFLAEDTQKGAAEDDV